MSSKKKTPTIPSTNLQALKIGSRVRCSDDRVDGRIVWANGVSVKIRWDDGEQVTWRRDSLGDRPIEILDAASDEDQHAAPDAPATPEQAVAEPPVEPATTEPAPAEQPVERPRAESTEMSEAVAIEQTTIADTLGEEAPPSEPAQEAQKPHMQTENQPETPSVAAKQPRTRKTTQAGDDGKEKKVSALDAAARVLGETGQPMNCQEMITAMAAKGYWNSPGGKTPHATLYSAIAREITTKGTQSRFVKADRGTFALADSAV
jgi:outer membrane biosynthesis protein TonB